MEAFVAAHRTHHLAALRAPTYRRGDAGQHARAGDSFGRRAARFTPGSCRCADRRGSDPAAPRGSATIERSLPSVPARRRGGDRAPPWHLACCSSAACLATNRQAGPATPLVGDRPTRTSIERTSIRMIASRPPATSSRTTTEANSAGHRAVTTTTTTKLWSSTTSWRCSTSTTCNAWRGPTRSPARPGPARPGRTSASYSSESRHATRTTVFTGVTFVS